MTVAKDGTVTGVRSNGFHGSSLKQFKRWGFGHGLVSWYLKNIAGLKVVTVDIDSRLNPDHVCSITELSNFFGPKSLDVVLAAEVLEHLPSQDFETSLRAMNCVCQWGAVITIPHSSKYI